MKRYKLLLAALVVLLLASCAHAFEQRITIAGKTYVGRVLGNVIEYKVGNEKLGEARRLGDTVVYRDAKGLEVGTAKPLGDAIIFRDGRGAELGTRKPLGDKHIYRNERGGEMGEARVVGWKTEYYNERGLPIGTADTKDMPLRPIPLEAILIRQAKASENAVCLTRVTQVKPGGQAAAAGLAVNDVIIGYRGDSWTIFDFAGPIYQTTHAAIQQRISATSNRDDLFMIVYRPAKGEKDRANGAIVALGPMRAGKKGFNYNTAEACGLYTRKGSRPYADGILKIYAEWLAAGNDGPALSGAKQPTPPAPKPAEPNPPAAPQGGKLTAGGFPSIVIPGDTFLCLTRITKVEQGGQADAAGLRVDDFLIGYAGHDWTTISLAGPSHKETFGRIKPLVSATRDEPDLTMIVYRPQAGEQKGAAHGEIVTVGPMKPGPKGFTYTVAEYCQFYGRVHAKAYAIRIKSIYDRWVKAQTAKKPPAPPVKKPNAPSTPPIVGPFAQLLKAVGAVLGAKN